MSEPRTGGRVLYVTQMPAYSGAETAQLPILRADPDALVACPPDSEVEALMKEAGAATVPLPFRSLRHSGGILETIRSVRRGVASARDMRRILRAHPDRTVVYCISLRPGLIVSVASLGLRRRVVWVVPDYLPPQPLRTPVRVLASLTCAATLPLSQSIADNLIGQSRRLRSRTHVVYPGVDVASFDASVADPATPRAAIVGHVSPLKRTDIAVEVARRVQRVEPAFELEVVGQAQYRDEDFALERDLHTLVATDSELRSVVHFHQKVAVGPVLARCGLLLHCRDDEPFGMVLIEAMAAGLPVVAPDRGGPREIVVEGVTGFLYPPGDVAAATEAVLRLLRDRALARRMGQAGRQRVEDHFDARSNVEKLQDELARLGALRSAG